MSRGNQGFGASLIEDVAGDAEQQGVSPAESVMHSRSDSLHRIATGKIVTDRTEFVDPARCRPWAMHNRDLEHLSAETCADLIEAFKSAGRQRIPAIVRRVRNDPDIDFEIIAGVRRWWTVSWLRANHHPEFEYLVTTQALTDEEAFRVSDVENRARKDISDLERARDYLRALDAFYGGSQTAMAERLNVSKSWMSRILEVGRLPNEILDAFADSHQVTARIAGQIAPLLKSKPTRDRLFAAALRLRQDRSDEAAPLSAADTTRQLLAAAADPVTSSKRPRSPAKEVAAGSGKTMLHYVREGRGGGLTIKVLPRSGASIDELVAAFRKIVEDAV